MTSAESDRPGTVDRLYVLDGGTCHIEDISQWSPGVDVGRPMEFSCNVYLLRHGEKWMVWDTGLDDHLAGEPEGEVFAHEVRGVVTQTLEAQLREIGVEPGDVDVLAVSHGHFDHVGNTRLFPRARWFVQRTEHEAMFGPDREKYGFVPELYQTLEDNEVVLLDGDCDVFGDGSVTILSTPGHTPGHQSLLVRLEHAGTVLLSGDVAHFRKNLRFRRVPTFNADPDDTVQSMDAVVARVTEEDGVLWINHDAQQTATLRRSPDYID